VRTVLEMEQRRGENGDTWDLVVAERYDPKFEGRSEYLGSADERSLVELRAIVRTGSRRRQCTLELRGLDWVVTWKYGN
jgi:hypothetical protein